MIKSTYPTLEEIPEKHRDLYEERDGVFLLTKIEGLKTEDDITKLRDVIRKEKEQRKKAESLVKQYGYSPDEINKMMDEFDVNKEKAVAREANKMRQELETANANASALAATLGAYKIQSELTHEATKLGVDSSALEDVLLWGEKLYTYVDGKVVSKDDNNFDTPGQWLEKTKTEGNKKHWFNQPQGAGAIGSLGTSAVSTGAKHFTKGSMNLVEMISIESRDSAEANKLAKQAGHENFEAAMDAVVKENSKKLR